MRDVDLLAVEVITRNEGFEIAAIRICLVDSAGKLVGPIDFDRLAVCGAADGVLQRCPALKLWRSAWPRQY